jgi:AraC-like DNA-binding protein
MTAAPDPPPVDVARNDVRMDGVYFRRISVGAPFAKSLEPGAFSYCVMVRAGRLRLETDFPVAAEVELGPGDAVAVSGLAPHAFRTLRQSAPSSPGRFEPLPLAGNSPTRETELVLGVAPNAALALGTLMIGPIIVRPADHPDLSRRLWRAVDMLEDEYGGASWIDRELVVRRLAEIMAVNFSRRIFADRRSADGEPSMTPASPPLMTAINAFFRSPERPWSLADLARAAGMSRTTFAEAFKRATGQTPGRIIARMRLTAIARRLAGESLSIEAAADAAGYSSAAAFVRAFQREFGETPARWRRQRRRAEAETLRGERAVARPRLIDEHVSPTH